MNHTNEKEDFWKKNHSFTSTSNSTMEYSKLHKEKLKESKLRFFNSDNNVKTETEENNKFHIDYSDAFNAVDTNNDGRITMIELKDAFAKLGNIVSDEDVAKMIQGADLDNNGTVELDEFEELIKRFLRSKPNKSRNSDSEAYEVFKAFDHNGDDILDFNEIKRTMIALGEKVTDDDVKAMIIEADLDQNGKVDFLEFKRIMEMYKNKSSI